MSVSEVVVAAVAAGPAVAVFVKTPALSPVKTRLAAAVGCARARAVYEESLAIMRRRLRQVAAAGVAVQWAVAEQAAAEAACWGDFPAQWTGEGTLGQRLHRVYARLRRAHGRVALVGADCPQLTAAAIVEAAGGAGTVIGPARDGGFYLFAAEVEITAAQWQAPRYSCGQTLAMLTAALDDDAITLLPPLTDIDDVESLARCVEEFAAPAEAEGLRRLLADVDVDVE